MKLCGCLERCFESREQWMCYSDTMCKNLFERSIEGNIEKSEDLCFLTEEKITVYTIINTNK